MSTVVITKTAEVVPITRRRYKKKPKEAPAAASKSVKEEDSGVDAIPEAPAAVKKQKALSSEIQSSFALPRMNTKNKRKRKRPEVAALHRNSEEKPLVVHNVVAKACIYPPAAMIQDVRWMMCGNYDEQQFPSCNIPLKSPMLTVGINRYGQVGATGGDTRDDEALYGIYAVAFELFKLTGLPMRVLNFRIVNMASSGNFGARINIKEFWLSNRKHTHCFDDMFPGLKWAYKDIEEMKEDLDSMIRSAVPHLLSKREVRLLNVPEYNPHKNKKKLVIILFQSGRYNVVGLCSGDDERYISDMIDCFLLAWTWMRKPDPALELVKPETESQEKL